MSEERRMRRAPSKSCGATLSSGLRPTPRETLSVSLGPARRERKPQRSPERRFQIFVSGVLRRFPNSAQFKVIDGGDLAIVFSRKLGYDFSNQKRSGCAREF